MAEPRRRDLRERTFAFACRAFRSYPQATTRHEPSYVAWRQLLKACGSVAANVEEAEAASSRADFHAKMRIALRESRESLLWLRMIEGASLLGKDVAGSLRQEAWELVAILTTIVKKTARPR